MRSVLTILICFSVSTAFYAQTQTRIFSIQPEPGDLFTHAGSNYLFKLFFQPLGWYYGHVQYHGIVGINARYPRSGNGSVYFETPTGLGKSDIEYRHDIVGSPPYWGRLGDLEWLSYEYYRDAQSTAPSHLHVPIRIYVGNWVNGRIVDPGYLIYEHSVNFGVVPIPTDMWIQEEVVASNRRVWQNPINQGNFFDAQPFSVWKSPEGYQPREGSRIGVHWNADSVVYGISLGAGTGWSGRFVGAIDNVVIRFRNGVEYHFNFEARLAGDVNADGAVDDADLLEILLRFGSSCAGCAWDINGDRAIDDGDLLIVLMNFGRGL